ncbi:uncharacterized protein [Watersipora subatra]|uniref:uncharacterized protein n=1 Tax=Watersipora subatra TaxID=2589382 RepID=UPI00355BBC37
MDDHGTYDNWLLETKNAVGSSREWKSFVEQLQGALDHHLVENHVHSFLDLQPRERLLFVDRVSKTIQNGQSYDELYDKISLILDQQVNNTIAKRLLVDSTAVESTKSELLIDHLKDGAVNILRHWPEMKNKLHMCLNIPLPVKLRSAAWTMFMSDINARREYLEKLMKDPQMAVSRQDKLITETCENILKIQNTFPTIAPPSVGPFFAMKAVLSYVHAKSRGSEDLNHVYYLLTLPMLHVLSGYISAVKPASNNVVAILVEMYLTFLRDMPKYVADTKNEHRTDRKTFSDKVAEHLVNYDGGKFGGVSNHMANLTIPDQADRPSNIDKEVLLTMLSDVLFDVISPLILSLFVGFLNKDSLMYVWDQYVIGLDVAGYHLHFLSAFTATLLLLIHDDILNCHNVPELIATVQRETHKVNVRMIQAKMKSLHFQVLYAELNQRDKAAVPVIDPVKVVDKSWNHWNNAIIPDRTSLKQKQMAREARQAERDRLLQQRRDDELRIRRELAEQHRLAEESLRELAERRKAQKDGEQSEIHRQLQEERDMRDARDRSYQEELDKLRREIEQLKEVKGRTASISSGLSYRSILAPPPTRQSSQPKFDPIYTRQHSPNERPQAIHILADVISAVANNYKILAHGDGKEADDLNASTISDLAAHEEDAKEAEKQVFGRALHSGELETLPEHEKREKEELIIRATLERVEDRYIDS